MINRLLALLPHNAFNQRWGLMSSMRLTDPDGTLYLFRRRIFQTPWCALYLHSIAGPDSERALHSHPFPFTSLIISGGYLEKVAWPDNGRLGPIALRYHRTGSRNVFPRGPGKVHRITWAAPGTRTLVLAGRRRDSWGFFVDGHGLVPWRQYLLEAGRDPHGGRSTVKENAA